MVIKNSGFVFRSARNFALAAVLCLSFVFLTGCGKAEAESDITPPSDSVQTEDVQEQTDESASESKDSGFVIEDTSVVDVDIEEE